MLKRSEDMHIWILGNFMGEFMGGSLWVAEGISFQKLVVCESLSLMGYRIWLLGGESKTSISQSYESDNLSKPHAHTQVSLGYIPYIQILYSDK